MNHAKYLCQTFYQISKFLNSNLPNWLNNLWAFIFFVKAKIFDLTVDPIITPDYSTTQCNDN